MKTFKFKLFKWTIELSELSEEEQVNNVVEETLAPFKQEKSLAQQVDDYALNKLGAILQEETGHLGKIVRIKALRTIYGPGNLMNAKHKIEELFEDNGKGAPRCIK